MKHSERTTKFVASAAVVLVLMGCVGSDPSERPTPQLRDSTQPTEFTQDFGSHTRIGETVDVELTLEETGRRVRPQNAGISLEATDLADPRLDPAASTFSDRLNELGEPALRFGGNRLDRNVFWSSSGETPPDSEHVPVVSADLEWLRKLTDATGATVTLGVPLGVFDPERSADMATHAQRILGDALVGVAIGNEPNGYTVAGDPNHRLRNDLWNTGPYAEQIEEYGRAIEEAAPGLSAEAFGDVIDAVGPLATYSRVAFSEDTFDFAEGTNWSTRTPRISSTIATPTG